MKQRHINEYLFFSEAWFLLAISRILILFRPFKKLLPIIGDRSTDKEAEHAATEIVTSIVFLKLIHISILRACRRSPWRTMCFEQALCARMMLKRRNINSVIFFGLNKASEGNKEKLVAHAWVRCSGFPVTGGKDNSAYTIVGRFI